jgi:hypothetical protein
MTRLSDWYYGARCEACGLPYIYDRKYASALMGRPPGVTLKWDCQCGKQAHVLPDKLAKWRIVPHDE